LSQKIYRKSALNYLYPISSTLNQQHIRKYCQWIDDISFKL